MLLEVELLEMRQERERRQAAGGKRRLPGNENEALPLQQHQQPPHLQQHPQPSAMSPAAAARAPQHKSPRVSLHSGGRQQQAGSGAGDDHMQVDGQQGSRGGCALEALQPERRAAAAARQSGTGAGLGAAQRASGRPPAGSGPGRHSGAGGAGGSCATAGDTSLGAQEGGAAAQAATQLLPAFIGMRICRPALWQSLWCACQPALSYYLAPAWQEADEERPGGAAQSHQLQVAASLLLLCNGSSKGQQLMSQLLLRIAKVRRETAGVSARNIVAPPGVPACAYAKALSACLAAAGGPNKRHSAGAAAARTRSPCTASICPTRAGLLLPAP
jgi:hypothetical protein